MDFIEELKNEHEEIEREFIELESIMEDEDINYSNFAHVFKRLCELWDEHELKEEKIFPVMKKEQIIIPVKTMMTQHRDLKLHKIAIDEAIYSGSQVEMKKALDEHVKVMIEKFRGHINTEENILFAITIEIFSPEEMDEIEMRLKE